MNLNIRRANSNDIKKLLEIQKKAFLVQAVMYNAYEIPPMTEAYEDVDLDSEKLIVLVGEIDGRLAGSIRVAYGQGEAELKRLSVADEFQNRGIGSKLIMAAENYCRDLDRVWLFTGGQSAKNISLYKKHGYKLFKEEPFKDNFTLIYMEKYL